MKLHTTTVKTFAQRLELVLIGSVLLAIFCASIQLVGFHPDESYWISTSGYPEVLTKADLASPAWHGFEATVVSSPVTRYVIRIGRRIGGYRDVNAPWDYFTDRAANTARGAMPSAGLLWWSRLPMAILAVLCSIIAFTLVSCAAGRLAGYVMLVLFLVNPYFFNTLCRAMNESPLLTSTMLAALAGHRALIICRRVAARAGNIDKTFFRPLIWFGIMGVFCGIAGAAKLNGLSTLPAGLALCVLAPLAQKTSIPSSRLISFITSAGALIVLAAGFSFVALNPQLYRDPVGRTKNMVEHRLTLVRGQQEYYSHSRMSGLTTLPLVGQRVFMQYAALRFPKSYTINIPLCFIGLCSLLYTAWYWLRSGRGSGASAVLLLIAFTSAGPALMTPLDWERYYLLPVFFSTIFIAVGLSCMIKKLSEWARHKHVLLEPR